NKKGCIDYCNDTYALALGYTKEKIIAENLDLLSKSDIDLYAQSLQALQLTQPHAERVHAVLQGQRRFLEIGTYPNCQQHTTVGYAIDMTEVDELEQQLKETTSAYHEILNTISVPIAVYNQKKRLTFYNNAFVKLFDFNKTFLENDVNLADILDDLRNRKKIPEYNNFREFKRQQLDLFNNIIKAREEFIDLPNEDTLRVHIAPYPLGGIIFVYENITDQLNLQRGVNTLQAVHKETINHLYEALIVIEKDGKIQLLNQAMFQLFNIDPAMQYLGQPFRVWADLLKGFFIDEDQHKHWLGHVSGLFTNRHPIQERLFLLNDLVVNWFYTPLPDGSHMLGFLNVSEQWQQERILKAQTMTLEESHTTKKHYIQQVTHQLERPIDNVMGFSKALSQQLFGTLNEKQRHYCALIERNIKNIRFLIHDVLSLLGLDQYDACYEPKVFLFAPLIHSLEDLIEDIFQDKGMDFIFTGTLSNERVYACERAVKQGLFTLIKDLSNRIPQGGTVTINTENKTNEGMLWVHISATCDGALMKAPSLGSSIGKHIFDAQK
ncbi:MAG: PAS-domain containing protein, partial [Alphaproteobacteria bacterium]|nr:PAS-domain containing protein [Alphaproteobacteria bacterium]